MPQPDQSLPRQRRLAGSLTETDHAILVHLADGPASGSDISEALGLGKGLGSRLASLRKRGYVESYLSPNATTILSWRLKGDEKGSVDG